MPHTPTPTPTPTHTSCHASAPAQTHTYVCRAQRTRRTATEIRSGRARARAESAKRDRQTDKRTDRGRRARERRRRRARERTQYLLPAGVNVRARRTTPLELASVSCTNQDCTNSSSPGKCFCTHKPGSREPMAPPGRLWALAVGENAASVMRVSCCMSGRVATTRVPACTEAVLRGGYSSFIPL
jgi:hypothetical protein